MHGRAGPLFGMRVWLALAFGIIVACTAAAVATVFLGRFDAAFDERAGELAVGYSVDVAIRAGVVLEVDCPPNLVAHAESSLLEQTVGNLVANALHHTARGRVVLSARAAGEGRLEIGVADTGPGIPADAQDRVFDRFFRGGDRGADGFSLGLAIARESVRAIGGEVVVESGNGAGTRARVLLQAHDSRP